MKVVVTVVVGVTVEVIATDLVVEIVLMKT